MTDLGQTHTPSNARFVIHFWAQTGNEICPLGATCLPMLGNVLAPCGQRACPKNDQKYHEMTRSKRRFKSSHQNTLTLADYRLDIVGHS